MSLGVIGFQGMQHTPWMLRLTVLRAIMLIYNYFSAVGPCDWFLSCSLVVVKAVGQNGCYHIKPLFYCWVMNWKFLASNERTGGITKWNDANLVHWYFMCVCLCVGLFSRQQRVYENEAVTAVWLVFRCSSSFAPTALPFLTNSSKSSTWR